MRTSSETTRGTSGRPSTAEVTDPQAAKEARIREVFKEQYRLLAKLFPKDGDTMVNRACAAAVVASRTPNKKTGRPLLERVPAESIAEKVIAAHHMGVEIGDSYLVPYGTDLQLIIGPRSLISLMYRSGFVKSVEVGVVFDGDVWEYELGDQPRIRHVKRESGRYESTVIAAYFIAHTTTGGIVREVLTREDINYYRAFSKAEAGPWFDNFPGMVRKTAIHRGAEYIPRSPLLSAALMQNEHGGIEVPEEIMAAVRRKMAAEAFGAKPDVVPTTASPTPQGDPEPVPASDDGRGAEGGA